MAVIFFKIKAKSTGVAVATASIFNAEIEKRNHISLSSLSSQSTRLSLFFCIQVFLMCATYTLGKAQSPVPSLQQLEWHNMKFYLFVHFYPNTFTDQEWCNGNQDMDIFYPTMLDFNQWRRTSVASGAKSFVLPTKDHDSFCLWPSKFSTHNMAYSMWKNRQDDVLKSLSDSNRLYGLKIGVYVSQEINNQIIYGTK